MFSARTTSTDLLEMNQLLWWNVLCAHDSFFPSCLPRVSPQTRVCWLEWAIRLDADILSGLWRLEDWLCVCPMHLPSCLSMSKLSECTCTYKLKVRVTQSCPTLHCPKDCSPPGSSVHGVSQARALEWVAISFSRGSSWPWDWTWDFSVSSFGRGILYHQTTWEAPC